MDWPSSRSAAPAMAVCAPHRQGARRSCWPTQAGRCNAARCDSTCHITQRSNKHYHYKWYFANGARALAARFSSRPYRSVFQSSSTPQASAPLAVSPSSHTSPHAVRVHTATSSHCSSHASPGPDMGGMCILCGVAAGQCPSINVEWARARPCPDVPS